jgi:hypothetical protein
VPWAVDFGMARPSENIEHDVILLKDRSQAMQIAVSDVDIGKTAAVSLVRMTGLHVIPRTD